MQSNRSDRRSSRGNEAGFDGSPQTSLLTSAATGNCIGPAKERAQGDRPSFLKICGLTPSGSGPDSEPNLLPYSAALRLCANPLAIGRGRSMVPLPFFDWPTNQSFPDSGPVPEFRHLSPVTSPPSLRGCSGFDPWLECAAASRE